MLTLFLHRLTIDNSTYNHSVQLTDSPDSLLQLAACSLRKLLLQTTDCRATELQTELQLYRYRYIQVQQTADKQTYKTSASEKVQAVRGRWPLLRTPFQEPAAWEASWVNEAAPQTGVFWEDSSKSSSN